MPVKAYFLTEITKMFSRHFYEDERSILHLSPFFCIVNLMIAENH